MDEMEERLARLGGALVAGGDGLLTSPAAVIGEARKRRYRRLGVTGGTALMLLAVMVATVAVSANGRETKVATTPTAPTTTTTTTTTTSATTVSTSAVAPSTSTKPAPDAVRASTAPTITTTVPPDGLDTGLWVMGRDGSGPRRLNAHVIAVWSPDGESLAAISGDFIEVFSAQDGHLQRKLPTGDPSTWCIDWSSRGELAWVGREGQVRVAGPGDTEGRVLAQGNEYPPMTLCAWSPDGTLFAVAGDAVSVYTRDGELLRRWGDTDGGDRADNKAHRRYTTTVTWSPDSSKVAVVERDETTLTSLVVFDPRVAVVNPRSPSPDGRRISRVAWHPDSMKLYVQTGGYDSDVAHFLVKADDRTSTSLHDVCCRYLLPLAEGRFLGFAPADGREDGQLVLVGAGFVAEQVLARARAPIVGPQGIRCQGPAFVSARLSPDGTRIAVSLTMYGPCR